MCHVIPAVLSLGFIECFQGCHEIELERRTVQRSHQGKALVVGVIHSMEKSEIQRNIGNTCIYIDLYLQTYCISALLTPLVTC